MMRFDSFLRSAAFAALAAAGALPWLVVVGGALGSRMALGLYLVGLTATYLSGLGRPGPSRFATAAGAAALGGTLLAVVHSQAELVLGLGAILAVARGGFLYRARSARAVLTEIVLVGAGLLFARALAGSSGPGVVLAIWGFFLVQSLFFLVGGVEPRPARPGRRDPFDEAYTRAVALLDGAGWGPRTSRPASAPVGSPSSNATPPRFTVQR
jgi:hypothetical protein